MPREDWPRIKGMIVSHNHPLGWNYPAKDPRSGGSSFSLSDLELARYAEVAEFRAVSRKYRHSVKPGPGGWSADYFETTLRPAYEKTKDDVRNDFRDQVSRSMMSGKTAESRFYHEIMERVGRELGLGYRRTK